MQAYNICMSKVVDKHILYKYRRNDVLNDEL